MTRRKELEEMGLVMIYWCGSLVTRWGGGGGQVILDKRHAPFDNNRHTRKLSCRRSLFSLTQKYNNIMTQFVHVESLYT
jgi:hypothetical protein